VRAEAVSAEVHHFRRGPSAMEFILQRLHAAGIADQPGCYAVWADGLFLRDKNKRQLAKQIPGLFFDVTRELAASAGIGISQMDWAMASTGSLIQDAAAVERRLVSTLPGTHIAIVQTNRLVADMPAVFRRIRPEQTNYISFITGPSRTADIERVL